MNIRQRIFMTLALGVVVIIGLAAAATWNAARTQAQGEDPRERRGPHIRASRYGLHTLRRGETARLSAVNPVLGAPPDNGRPHSMTLAFDIYETVAADGSVRTLRFLRRVSHTLVLQPGEAAELEFEPSRANETICASVFSSPPDPESETNPPDIGRQAVVTSLQVRQGNSTQFVLPVTQRFAVNAF